MCVCMYVCMYVSMCVHVCVYVRTCVCLYVCMYELEQSDLSSPRDNANQSLIHK